MVGALLSKGDMGGVGHRVLGWGSVYVCSLFAGQVEYEVGGRCVSGNASCGWEVRQ